MNADKQRPPRLYGHFISGSCGSGWVYTQTRCEKDTTEWVPKAESDHRVAQARAWLREAEDHIKYLLDDGECDLYRRQAQEFLDKWKERQGK